MNELTNSVQVITQDGKPVFAVIPYNEYLELVQAKAHEPTIPHEVVALVIEHEWSLVKAWRKHLGITQEELAHRTGITQPALSQIEKSDNPRNATIEKLAAAMGLDPEQMVDID